jgi:pimeloyl-ACP methyl ester carboxylesterase
MSYSEMAEDVRELMDSQGLRHASILGHSMGGKTAMQLALSHPERVEKLVVVDIAPKTYQPHHEQILQTAPGERCRRSGVLRTRAVSSAFAFPKLDSVAKFSAWLSCSK